MKRVLAFYQPFVSSSMPAEFQWGEVVAPIVATTVLATAASVPLFVTHEWLAALLSIVLLFVLLNTIQAAISRFFAVRRTDGTLYIPGSDLGVARMMSGFVSLVIVGGYALLLVKGAS